MTGYYLEPGYQSSASREEAWDALKRIVGEVCAKPEEIAREAIAFGSGMSAEGDSIFDYADLYRTQKDLTIRVKEKGEVGVAEDAHTGHVVQYASGGGASRDMKEHLRRAFCRIVIREMHRLGYEVNMTVA